MPTHSVKYSQHTNCKLNGIVCSRSICTVSCPIFAEIKHKLCVKI